MAVGFSTNSNFTVLIVSQRIIRREIAPRYCLTCFCTILRCTDTPHAAIMLMYIIPLIRLNTRSISGSEQIFLDTAAKITSTATTTPITIFFF